MHNGGLPFTGLKKKVQRTERETNKAVVVDLPKPRPSSGSPS